jgi:hypothetical protein
VASVEVFDELVDVLALGVVLVTSDPVVVVAVLVFVDACPAPQYLACQRRCRCRVPPVRAARSGRIPLD